jgi:hypothetical protein
MMEMVARGPEVGVSLSACDLGAGVCTGVLQVTREQDAIHEDMEEGK